MTVHSNVLDMIGNTPMIEVSTFDTGPCRLFLKLENQNPGGSIKDRIALSMVEAAERSGAIGPGGTLIEATAGNTGLGLALVARQKGYRLMLVIPDKMSQEKIFNLQAMGAEVTLTRSDVGKGHPEYYQDMAERLARETPNSVFINQFGNPANPLAHETGTGPEIWSQMGHDVDAVVAGVGSGGTITGLGRFFAKVAPDVEMVLADPAGSVLANYIRTGEMGPLGSWLVEGIGEDFIPPVSDLSLVKTAYSVTDKEAFPHGPAAPARYRHPGRLVGRHPDRGGARLLPRPDQPQEGRDLRPRQRQQVPLQDVQRLLDARSGLSGATPPRRPPRPDRPPAHGPCRGHREARRHAGRGARAHEAL